MAFRYLDFGRSQRRGRGSGAHLDTVPVYGCARSQPGFSRPSPKKPSGSRSSRLWDSTYVTRFHAAAKAGTIAVPLFAPELLPATPNVFETALADSPPCC